MKKMSKEKIHNDELKKAISAFKINDDDQNKNHLILTLREAYFLVPALKESKNNQLEFMLLTNERGHLCFQAYTDQDEYDKFPENDKSQSFVLTFEEFANIVITSNDQFYGLVVNPFGESIVLDKKSLEQIFLQDKVVVSKSQYIPIEILDLVGDVLSTHIEIKKAYLVNIAKGDQTGYLLVIDSYLDDETMLFQSVGEEITTSLKDIALDITSFKDKNMQRIVKDKRAIYEKETT